MFLIVIVVVVDVSVFVVTFIYLGGYCVTEFLFYFFVFGKYEERGVLLKYTVIVR